MPTTIAVPSKSGATPRAIFERNWITRRMIHHRFGLEPDAADLGPLAEVCGRCPRWVQAQTLPEDLLFLHDMIRCTRPSRVVEIGVASGLSTSIILHALAANGGPLTDELGVPRVQSVDILASVPWDAKTPIGAAVREIVPDLSGGSVIHTRKTSLDLPALLGTLTADFAFVDGAHSHPWPALDVLMLSRVLRPGSWMVLHDISLVERAHIESRRLNLDSVDFGARGAEYLYECWPGEKLRGVGDCWNLAAIRLPAGGSFDPASLRDLVAIPWETGLVLPAIHALHAFVGESATFVGANMHRDDQRLPGRSW